MNVLAFGPKISLVKDHLAVYVPIGSAWGSGVETSKAFEVHPTLLGTLLLSRSAELNGSVKWLLPVNDSERDKLVGFNVGLGLGPDVKTWAIRPEVGMLINPGASGRFFHFSLGVTRYVEP